MSRPRLLLVPAYTELQWTIAPALREWAEVASFDPPGVGEEPLPPEATIDQEATQAELRVALRWWREATAQRGLEECEKRGWDEYVLVVDGDGTSTAMLIAEKRPEAVRGLAIGHAALSRSAEGERPTINKEVYEAMGTLMQTDSRAFIRHGIAQLTRGSIGEDLADQIFERFPDVDTVGVLWKMLTIDTEPIGEQLKALGLPLLFGQHVGCIGSTEEGFEDIVAAFPEADVIRCPEACEVSPAFADALREFCDGLFSSR